MIQLTPPLGWNSWNTFGSKINEKMILETADAMIETGLFEHGYNYLVIDDCWSKKLRDENGLLAADEEKFPHGMKYVADYVHSKGLKFGMYSCAGTLTCGGFPGSFEHEYVDAETFASWGVDLLKYDYCFHPSTVPGHVMYKRMGTALANCGRDILFSACSWGADGTKEWIKSTGAHMWRTTGDIFDNWKSIKELSMKAGESIPYSGKGCFADMDMLVVGMYGEGNVGFTGCTVDEYRTHFSLWALLGSPLMVGCDIRNIDDTAKEILMNRDILEINQDIACRQPYMVKSIHDDNPNTEHPVYVKSLENGDLAIGMFNFTDDKSNYFSMNFSMDSIGLPESCGKTLLLKNLWTGEETTVYNGIFNQDIEGHGCRLFRAKVVDN